MSLSRLLLVASLALMVLGSTAHATIIYDNGVPDGQAYYFSDASFSQFLADDFSLAPGSTTITDVHWWGRYYTPGGVLPDDDFVVSIYEQVAGAPAISALYAIAVGSVSRIDVGSALPGVYEYSVDIAPVTLAANTTYYLGITNNTGSAGDAWLWATSDGHSGDFSLRANSADPWLAATGELAFNLTNDHAPVPEPATMSLLSMGLVGLLVRARRRRSISPS